MSSLNRKLLLVISASLTLTYNIFAHTFSDYGSWVDANFSSAEISSGGADNNYDSDKDGLSNFLEFAFHRDPHVADASGITTVTIGGDGHLLLTFDALPTPDDFSYFVEVSNDLKHWQTGSGQVEKISSTVISTNRTRYVFRDKIAGGPIDKRFMRVVAVADDDDSDDDGISDYIELEHYGTLTWNGGSGGGIQPDSDGDGRSDLQEELDGTDPNDSGSFSLPDYTHQLQVKWHGTRISQARSPTEDWHDVPGALFEADWPNVNSVEGGIASYWEIDGRGERNRLDFYFTLEDPDAPMSAAARSAMASSSNSSSSIKPHQVEWAIIHGLPGTMSVQNYVVDLADTSETYSEPYPSMDMHTNISAIYPACPTIYMFSGHDGDVVTLKTTDDYSTYEWKLKNSSGAQGKFQNEGSTTWSATATTSSAYFRAGGEGSPNIAGSSRSQSPGTNVIQLFANGVLIFEKPLEVIEIKPRSSWSPNPPHLATMQGLAFFKRVTFHHSKDQRDGPEEIKRIQEMHMRSKLMLGKGFDDIGYHFVMTHNGDIYEARQSEGLSLAGGPYTKGSHVLENNTEAGVGICALGQYQPGLSEPDESFPSTRQASLEKAITAICRRYNIPFDAISYHSAMALPAVETTECPGRTVKDKANEMIADVKTNLE